MFDVTYMGFADLRGTGSKQKHKNKNMYPQRPVAVIPGALDHLAMLSVDVMNYGGVIYDGTST